MAVVVMYHQGCYHHADNAERWAEDAQIPHHASPDCWCGPRVMEMGRDVAGRPLLLVQHGLERPDFTGWEQLNPLAGTGPFVDDPSTPHIEVVQTTGLVLVAKDMAEVEALVSQPHQPF